MEVPDHDLEPPKFSRRALERLLNDWAAVRAMIMTGHKEEVPPSSASTDEINFMQYQGHTTHLDKFTYCLLVKLTTQVRKILVIVSLFQESPTFPHLWRTIITFIRVDCHMKKDQGKQ